jgi:hypothetical protein
MSKAHSFLLWVSIPVLSYIVGWLAGAAGLAAYAHAL